MATEPEQTAPGGRETLAGRPYAPGRGRLAWRRVAALNGSPVPVVGQLLIGQLLVGAVVVGSLFIGESAAQAQQPAITAAQNVADDAVVALTDGEPIRYLEVKRQIVTALGGRAIPAEALPKVQAATLDQIIYRKLITAEFHRRGLKLTPAEEQAADQAFEKELARLKMSRDEYLRRNRLTDDDLAEFRYWDVNWKKFVTEELSDERLQAFYNAHRRDYDGTEVRVSHILLRLHGQGAQANIPATVEKATGIRDSILNGTISFADAARRHSDGPSREQGGDLGFIPRRERMVEEFSAAAFRLKKGEVSPPVVTTFGVHLITVTDEKPGKWTLNDVRTAITPAATAELYREVGRKLRASAKVEFTGKIAHLDPSGELVPAGR